MIYLNYKKFDIKNAKSAGGMTGSKQAKFDNTTNYQLKPSILDASIRRRVKAHGTDRENFGEVIAAAVGRALSGSDLPGALEMVPEVSLVYDSTHKRVLVASKYLDGVQEGTIDDYAKADKVDTDKRHVKVSFDKTAPRPTSDNPAKPKTDVYSLAGDDNKQMRKDLASCLAISVLCGDHDVNPGNMMVVSDKDKNPRIARIDFGHAFNDLLNAPKLFGGRVRNKGNQVLDFLNREELSNLVPSKRIPKLWRDYKNIVPSTELAEAFEQMGGSGRIKDGVNNAKESFRSLIDDLNKAPQDNQKVLDHIKKSLIAINNNVSDTKLNSKQNIGYVLDNTFNNLTKFHETGQKQMLDASKLMKMQLKIDEYVKAPDPKALDAIQSTYKELENTKGIGRGSGKGIEWIKNSRDSKASHMTLDEFIKVRIREVNGTTRGVNNIEPDHIASHIRDGFNARHENSTPKSTIMKTVKKFAQKFTQKVSDIRTKSNGGRGRGL